MSGVLDHPEESEGGRSRYADLLRNRRFVLYTISSTLANTGYAVYAISVPWLTLSFSRSFLLVGLVLFAEFGVYALTFAVAPWVDRVRDKRTIFLLCYPLQALAAGLIGLSLFDHFLTPGLLIGLVLVISFLWDFPWVAYNIVPRLLLPPDQLFRASGLKGLLQGASLVSGNAVGAALVVLVSPSGGMLLYAVLLILGAGVAALVSLPVTGTTVGTRYWTDFRGGWTHFARKARQSLLPLASVELVQGFFLAAPTLLIAAVAYRVLGRDASAYTILYVAWVVGGVAAGLVLGEANPRRQVGRILLVALVAQGTLVLLAVVSAQYLLWGAVAWLLFGAAAAAYSGAKYVFLWAAYPSDVVGRVTSNLYVFTGTSTAVGALVLGAVAGAWSPLEFAELVGLGFFVAGALVLLLPSIRRLAF